MSRRLTRLRTSLGDPLFVPAGRGLVPTERALTLGARIPALIDEMRAVLAPPQVDLASVERTLNLRANDGFAGYWASRLAGQVAKAAPSLTLCFMPRADKSVEALRDGRVDLDIGVADEAGPEIYTQRLFDAHFVGVVRADHPLAQHEIDAQALIAWPHISTSRHGRHHGPIDDGLMALGLRRKIAVIAPGFQTALAMVASSDMVAAMPEPFARWASAQLAIHIFTLPVPTPEVRVSQSWHPRFHADPVHSWVRQLVRDNCS